MGQPPADPSNSSRVRELYERAVADYGNALKRLARAYEADAERRRDVLQEMHLALWESLAGFDGRSAFGTSVYRVAHNTATSICIRRKRRHPQLVGLEDLESRIRSPNREREVDERRASIGCSD